MRTAVLLSSKKGTPMGVHTTETKEEMERYVFGWEGGADVFSYEPGTRHRRQVPNPD